MVIATQEQNVSTTTPLRMFVSVVANAKLGGTETGGKNATLINT